MTSNEHELEDERALCRYCKAPVPENEWFGLEVTRPVKMPDGSTSEVDVDFLDAVFCSQEHAALWLAAPIPPTVVPQVTVFPRWTRKLQRMIERGRP
ncbi:hypothetical protein [Georgenia muralis]